MVYLPTTQHQQCIDIKNYSISYSLLVTCAVKATAPHGMSVFLR